MKFHLKFYGEIAEVVGASEQTISVNETSFSANELKEELCLKSEKLKTIPFKIAVNNALVDSNTSLTNNDTISLLPPFAGG